MYKNLINNIIPADDLHWDKTEKKYVSLSEDEIKDIVNACMEQGITELDGVFKMIAWCGSIRVGNLLWKNFLKGAVKITGFDNDEPLFAPRKED
jgi:hypothetical protein